MARDYSAPRRSNNNPIARARIAKGMTQEQLGQAIGVDKRQISFWETGRFEIKLSTMVKIAKALCVDINTLIGEAEETTFQKARKAKGMTQGELANAIGCSRSTISYYESGKLQPPPEILTRIAELLEVPEDVLKE